MTNKDKKLLKLPWPYRLLRWTFPKVECVSPVLAGKWAARLFFRPFKVPTPKRESVVLNNAERFSEAINGKKVACYKWGEGTPVIMVHGWSGRGTQFYNFIDKFTSNGFQVITFDAPGHGFSTGKTTSVIEFSEIIKKLVDQFNAETIIGHSLGGVASLLASSSDPRIKNVLMISSPAIGEEIINDFLRNINASPATGNGIVKHIHKLTNKPFNSFLPLEVINNVRDLNLKIIHDRFDAQVSINHALAIKEKYPKVELTITEGNGHNRILSNEEVINQAMSFARGLS